MLVKLCKGYELEKEKPNTSEDFFNRSEVVYVENGEEKTLHVLYVRYFDDQINEFTPYTDKIVFQNGTGEVTFKDIVALVCLIKNPGLRDRKRIYINKQAEFASYFEGIDFSKLPEIFQKLNSNQGYELQSLSEFIVQPQ
ncbi:hypothetical protein [Bacillus marasmi]|uniref:hypothetical protein n=1 Tax=Bacillus marasmi TaxID=1926279 RepID=UPI0011CBF0D9|nr:hypothetical protein [Bacillus marasmi]